MEVIAALCILPILVSRLRLAVLLSLVSAGLLISASALGQSESNRATARALAAEGYKALVVKNYAVAEDRFRRADELVHAPTLVVDHGRALMGLGRYVEAQEAFELVLREGVSDSAPYAWKRALQQAGKLLEEVKPKVAWLTISVPDVENPKVSIDGKPIPVAALGIRRATDPGHRTVVATADGYESKQTTVDLDEGGEDSIELDLVALPPRERAKAPTPVTRTPKPAPEDRGASMEIPTYVAFGVGGAGLAVGAVTGVLALRKRSDLNSVCSGNVCPSTAQSDLDSYHKLGLISGIGFGVGIAGGVTGLVLLLTGEQSDASDEGIEAGIRPYVEPGGVGLQGAF